MVTDFDQRVLAAGGDPACLHCRLSQLLIEHLATLPGGAPLPCVTAHALAQIIGEMLSHSAPVERLAGMQMVLRTVARKAEVMVRDLSASEEPAVASPAIAPQKLH
jgi:hypothetical protein